MSYKSGRKKFRKEVVKIEVERRNGIAIIEQNRHLFADEEEAGKAEVIGELFSGFAPYLVESLPKAESPMRQRGT